MMNDLNDLLGIINLPTKIFSNPLGKKFVYFSSWPSNQERIYMISESGIYKNIHNKYLTVSPIVDFSKYYSFSNLNSHLFLKILTELILFPDPNGSISFVLFKESQFDNKNLTNPPDSLNLTATKYEVLNVFTKISLSIYDKLFSKLWNNRTKGDMFKILKKCRNKELKNEIEKLLNLPDIHPLKDSVLLKFPGYSQFANDPGWMEYMLIRELYANENSPPTLFLSFMKDGDKIEEKINFYIEQASLGKIEEATLGLAKIMFKIKKQEFLKY